MPLIAELVAIAFFQAIFIGVRVDVIIVQNEAPAAAAADCEGLNQQTWDAIGMPLELYERPPEEHTTGGLCNAGSLVWQETTDRAN